MDEKTKIVYILPEFFRSKTDTSFQSKDKNCFEIKFDQKHLNNLYFTVNKKNPF